jgi:hypothetical protein
MKDVIWTLIIIWLLVQITKVFRNASKPASQVNPRSGPEILNQKNPHNIPKRDLDRTGEYVDFEEIK